MKILLTGFDRFGKLERNPSQLVVERIAARAKAAGLGELTTAVLPVEFAAAGARIVQLIREIRPELIICLGVAQGNDAIHLERVALNLDDAEASDNAGVAHQGKLIVPDGPAAYWSTLPIERMRLALQQREIPARISNHAGTYVCNHVFYLARHEVERAEVSTACGFIHLPDIVQPARWNAKASPGLPLEIMIEAVELCVKLAPETETPSPTRADSP